MLFASGLAGAVFRGRVVVDGAALDDGLDAELGRLFGSEVLLAFSVGRARSNRKPVLLAMDPTGRLLGYVKLGINQLTDDLVSHEGDSLRALGASALGVVRVPQVLHRIDWRSHPLLVLEPLPLAAPRGRRNGPTTMQAMVSIATSQGTAVMTLAETPWWLQLTAEHFEGGGEDADRLQAAVRRLGAMDGHSLLVGCWHGDWNPGNYAPLSDSVLVWDWERFAEGVPVGWDALHHHIWTIVFRSGRPTPQALERELASAADLLAGFGVAPESRELVTTLYLVEITARFLRDDQRAHDSEMGDVGAWLLPVLERRVVALEQRAAIAANHHETRP